MALRRRPFTTITPFGLLNTQGVILHEQDVISVTYETLIADIVKYLYAITAIYLVLTGRMDQKRGITCC